MTTLKRILSDIANFEFLFMVILSYFIRNRISVYIVYINDYDNIHHLVKLESWEF